MRHSSSSSRKLICPRAKFIVVGQNRNPASSIRPNGPASRHPSPEARPKTPTEATRQAALKANQTFRADSRGRCAKGRISRASRGE